MPKALAEKPEEPDAVLGLYLDAFYLLGSSKEGRRISVSEISQYADVIRESDKLFLLKVIKFAESKFLDEVKDDDNLEDSKNGN